MSCCIVGNLRQEGSRALGVRTQTVASDYSGEGLFHEQMCSTLVNARVMDKIMLVHSQLALHLWQSGISCNVQTSIERVLTNNGMVHVGDSYSSVTAVEPTVSCIAHRAYAAYHGSPVV